MAGGTHGRVNKTFDVFEKEIVEDVVQTEFHRAGHGKMFMENKENESLRYLPNWLILKMRGILKKSILGKKKIKIATGDKKSEKVSMEVPGEKRKFSGKRG